MGTDGQNQFTSISASFLAYLPNLVAGLGLVLLGLIVGWVIKKLIVQLAVILRLDRMLLRSRWKEDLKKADVRYSLYNFVGNFVFALIFLIFLDNAFIAWKLTILSDLLGKGILYLPKIIIAALIWGLGWIVSAWIQRSVLRALLGEDVPRAALIARFVKSVFILFFSAMAIVELDVAKEIVIIGFAAIIVALAAIAVVVAVLGGRGFFQSAKEADPEDLGKPGERAKNEEPEA